MSYNAYKSELPASKLGDNRCVQVEYFGHGDIFIATWEGQIDYQPNARDEVSTCFNFAHGNDVVILASLAGYLRRLGRSQEQVKSTLREACREVVDNTDDNVRLRRPLNSVTVSMIADGVGMARYNIIEPPLQCLVAPIPSQPGIVERVGGTAIYTRPKADCEDTYVLSRVYSSRGMDGIEGEARSSYADFCSADVPIIARLVSQMALGEYRRDVQYFLNELYDEDI